MDSIAGSADCLSERVALERRFEDMGWGVLLLAIGTIWLVPEEHVPHGSWLIAAGLILLGLNAARFFRGIKMSGFSLVAGILALIAGLGEFFGVGVPLFPIALIVVGLCSLSYVDQCRPLPVLWKAVHEGSESRLARDLPMQTVDICFQLAIRDIQFT